MIGVLVSRIAFVLLLFLSVGCTAGEAALPPSSFQSADALGNAVLERLATGDREGMEALLVTREEYETYLWEQLPESWTFPLEYVWSLNQYHSGKALDEVVEAVGDNHFELVEITFDEPVEEYEGFRLYLGARMTVRRTSDGRVGELPLLDVLVERGGQWKLLNYSG